MTREEAIAYGNRVVDLGLNDETQAFCELAIQALEQTRWIPVSERLPKDLETVNVTWVNHEPEPYYHDIKDKSFVATAIFSKRTGHWYWYSTTCADYLGEYGENEIDKVDDAIEIVAWQPLPQPYKEVQSEIQYHRPE